MTDTMRIGGTTDDITARFTQLVGDLPAPRVLEIGTLRWEADRPTHHQDLIPNAASYVMADVAPGTDVDVVTDAHDLACFDDQAFDVVVAVSVWEHLQRPWIAAAAVARVLAPGGLAFICTHQSFPLHGYPHDYFRFSVDALGLLFTDTGLTTEAAGYAYPCQIIPPAEVTRWNPAAECYLNVAGIWRRP